MNFKKYEPSAFPSESTKPPVKLRSIDSNMTFRSLITVFLIFKFIATIAFLKFFGRLSHQTLGRLLTRFCEKRGLLWIKVGQLLSMRSDLFSAELCNELARLQDTAEGFPFSNAKELLERELGDLDNLFEWIDPAPVAAASIAQVHKGYLKKEKCLVAIKIKRPHLDQLYAKDFKIIHLLFSMFERLNVLRFIRWDDLLWELDQVFKEELDFRYEMSHQVRMRKRLARHNVLVPKVFTSYSTSHVMTMEFVPGVSMNSILNALEAHPDETQSWLKANQIDLETLGKRLLNSFLRQVLEENLFHADLHPGNLFLLRNNRIALLDFGSVGSLDVDTLQKYDAFLVALSQEQFAKAIEVFILIARHPQDIDVEPMKEELLRRLIHWRSKCRIADLPYQEKSAVCVSDEMTRVMARFGFDIIWSFFKVLRGWTTMDTSLRTMIPKADLPSLMEAYHRSRQKRSLKRTLATMPVDSVNLLNLVDAPLKQVEMNMYRSAALRKVAQVFEGATSGLYRLGARFFGFSSALLFCLLLLTIYTFAINKNLVRPLERVSGLFQWLLQALPKMDDQIWILILVALGFTCLKWRRLARVFSERDQR